MRGGNGGIRIEGLGAADHEPAVAVLARAFQDNPLNRAVIRGSAETRRRANAHTMRALLAIAESHGVVLVARRGQALGGALVAAPPHAFPFPAPGLWTRLRVVLGIGLGVATRWAAVFEHLEARHPVVPHWYLGVLGVDPEHQRTGLGCALIERWLERVDADGEIAYLETDRRENVAFYQRAGFEVGAETLALDVPVWLMSRLAR
jgi:ribosomal protein S18 acetylase RimI-like enzyme